MKITMDTLKNLANNDGLTLKAYNPISYKSGYQVATEGIETEDEQTALNAIEAYEGNCGIWKCDGKYYIDKSMRVSEKSVALALGKACQQISILKWANMSLIYC